MLAPIAVLVASMHAAAVPPGERPGTPPAPRRGTYPSLLSARTLGDGGAALLFTAGVPFVSASYAQGVGDGLDAGAQLEVDWLSSEFFLGGTARAALRRAGEWDVAVRGRAGLYANTGADWWVEENRSGSGIQLSPGVVASLPGRRAVLSVSADLPLTVTFQRGGGFVAAPRAAVALETPLVGDLSAGARLGGFWHVAGGGAPLARHPRGAVELSAVLTHRLF